MSGSSLGGSRRSLLAVIAALGALLTVSVGPLSSDASAARPRAASSGGNTSSVSARSASAVNTTMAYWTAARMKAAKPYEVAGGAAGAATSSAAPRASGAETTVPPSAGALGAGAAASSPSARAAVAVPRPYTDLPDRLNGKVFFSHGPLNYVCSGTMLNNPTENVVWTAGHCVADGQGDHRFHTNWMFVPAYSSNGSGNAPYGKWAAKSLHTKTAWIQNGNFRQDLGAVNLVKKGGGNLGQIIGGQGIRFNANAQQNYSDFGYPQAPPFNGNSQFRCNSPLVARDNPFNGPGPLTMKINCNMTGGSSGGGWLIQLNSGLGFVASVNSYGYTNDANHEYGPYQGSDAMSLYNSVKNG
jgi:hypothetical protein